MQKLVSALGSLLLAQLLVVAGAAAAPFAYVVGDLATNSPATIVQTNVLFRVDLATGEAVTIGVTQSPDCGGECRALGGISVHPTNGTLYAVADVDDLLITIDPATAQATVIDVLTLGGTPIPSIVGFGLTHDSGGTLYFAASGGRRLSVLSPSTAFLSDIASGTAAPNTQAIADADATHLWAIRRGIGADNYDLISVRKVTPGAPLPLDFITSIGAIVPPPTGDTLGLDLGPDGVLWGVQTGGSVGGGQLFRLDTATAAMTGITEMTVPATGQVVVNPRSLAIPGAQPVPAMNLGLLVLLAAALAWVVLRPPALDAGSTTSGEGC
jgi:hypothetical protein